MAERRGGDEWHRSPRLIVLLLALLLMFREGDGSSSEPFYKKLSGIIIPGFASTQLRAWSVLDCPFSPLDFNPLDSVWLDTTKVICTFLSLSCIPLYIYCYGFYVFFYEIEME